MMLLEYKISHEVKKWVVHLPREKDNKLIRFLWVESERVTNEKAAHFPILAPLFQWCKMNEVKLNRSWRDRGWSQAKDSVKDQKPCSKFKKFWESRQHHFKMSRPCQNWFDSSRSPLGFASHPVFFASKLGFEFEHNVCVLSGKLLASSHQPTSCLGTSTRASTSIQCGLVRMGRLAACDLISVFLSD